MGEVEGDHHEGGHAGHARNIMAHDQSVEIVQALQHEVDGKSEAEKKAGYNAVDGSKKEVNAGQILV